ncbi:hypothetical protein ACFO4L_11875 [Bacillus daqingensis]|uniref:Lipoprotein n=1 Tax=Bacillus daqingensis TaxID=872396 RepID=A0ABV9NZ07_9BACI
MKKGIIAAMLILTACGESEESAGVAGESSEPDYTTVNVPAENREALLDVMRTWSEEELDEDGGLFLASDSSAGAAANGSVVQQVAADDVSAAAESLTTLAETLESGNEQTVYLQSVPYSEDELKQLAERFTEEAGNWYNHGALIDVVSSIRNQEMDVRVTSMDAVDEAAIRANLGSISFINWHEAHSNERDDANVPVEAPDYTGTVTEIDDDYFMTIDDENDVDVMDGDIMKEGEEQLPSDILETGDEVEVWIGGAPSMRDEAYDAVIAVHVLTDETEERLPTVDHESWSALLEGETKVTMHPDGGEPDRAAIVHEPEPLAESLRIPGDLDPEETPFLAVVTGKSGSCAVEPTEIRVFESGLAELHPDPAEGHEGCTDDYNPYTLIIPMQPDVADRIEHVQPAPVSGHSELPVEEPGTLY